MWPLFAIAAVGIGWFLFGKKGTTTQALPPPSPQPIPIPQPQPQPSPFPWPQPAPQPEPTGGGSGPSEDPGGGPGPSEGGGGGGGGSSSGPAVTPQVSIPLTPPVNPGPIFSTPPKPPNPSVQPPDGITTPPVNPPPNVNPMGVGVTTTPATPVKQVTWDPNLARNWHPSWDKAKPATAVPAKTSFIPTGNRRISVVTKK